jgi:hypothetical protein
MPNEWLTNAPPINARAPLATGRREVRLFTSAKVTPFPIQIQLALVERPSRMTILRWTEESFRLLELWWTTGQARHMEAFVQHLRGMRVQIKSMQ